MRALDSGLLRNEVTTNGYVWGALALCVGLLGAAVYLPLLSDVLGTVDPGPQGWGLVVGLSLLPLIVGQIGKQLGLGEI
jgi:Ca2+-transporting ATPase